MSDKSYDLIAIGAGSAGLFVSIGMNMLGFKVLLIDEKEVNFGGDCLNYGCVPSKSLIHISRQVHAARQIEGLGMQVKGNPDLEKVMAYVHQRQEFIRAHENPAYLRGTGIDTAVGRASFVNKNTVQVNGQDYQAKKIVIATGSSPVVPDISGVDKIRYYNNKSIFNLKTLPERLLVIGGGPVGIELGQAFQRLGSEVNVVTSGERILEKELPEISQILLERLKEGGMQFYFNARCTNFPEANKAIVERKGENFDLDFDAALFAAGRKLDHESLALENAGIETENGKIKLNDYLQTTNPKVYVSGDAAGQMKFSHAAELHGRLLLNNFFSPIRQKVNYNHFSWVTFTEPEVATFGLNEEQLQERDKSYEKIEKDFAEDDRAVIEDYRYGKLILYTEKSRHPFSNTKIYGGSMIAPHAGELIQELILANAAGIGSSKISNKIYPYPVAARVNQGIFTERMLRKIGPRIKKLLKWLY